MGSNRGRDPPVTAMACFEPAAMQRTRCPVSVCSSTGASEFSLALLPTATQKQTGTVSTVGR